MNGRFPHGVRVGGVLACQSDGMSCSILWVSHVSSKLDTLPTFSFHLTLSPLPSVFVVAFHRFFSSASISGRASVQIAESPLRV